MQGACAVVHLLQMPQKWQLGFLVSLYLLCPEFAPTAAWRQLYFVSYSFFVFCCQRRSVSRMVFIDVSSAAV